MKLKTIPFIGQSHIESGKDTITLRDESRCEKRGVREEEEEDTPIQTQECHTHP